MPPWLSSIRFRLAMTFASVVFCVGAVLVGGLYLWQVRQLEAPTLTGEYFELEHVTVIRTTLDDVVRVELESMEQRSYLIALDRLRTGSVYALLALAAASFGAGWLLSGWALRPVGRIRRTAAEISGSDLSKRIALVGPADELKELADTFDAMLDRLQDSFNAQRQLAHDSSHELRNPLAVARVNLELAMEADDRDEWLQRSSKAASALERMTVLVDDMLAQARASTVELAMVQVDVGELLDEVAAEFGPVAAQRNLSIMVDAPDDLTVVGDRALLRQAVANLVANATRLAPRGTTVGVSAASESGANGPRVAFSVVDEGPGIDPAHHDEVFRRFWRADEATSGTGLGLSIVAQIAERHGGEVRLDSAPGLGSRFTVSLPV